MIPHKEVKVENYMRASATLFEASVFPTKMKYIQKSVGHQLPFDFRRKKHNSLACTLLLCSRGNETTNAHRIFFLQELIWRRRVKPDHGTGSENFGFGSLKEN